MKRTQRRAFTLIELLTVVAITAILLTLIVLPIFQTFNLTRTAQGFAEAQDKARSLAEQIAREIGNGAAVRDNSGNAGAITLVVPSGPSSTNTQVATTLPYMKIDIVSPAQDGQVTNTPGGPAFTNPNTGHIDPTLHAPMGQVSLPGGQGTTLTRYYVSLREPVVQTGPGTFIAKRYNNPYDGLLMPRGGGRDNLFVLRRAELNPYVFRNNGSGTFVPVGDQKYFEVDAANQPILDDPAFCSLLPTVDVANEQTGQLTAAGQIKAQRIWNWMQKSVIVTQVSRYDMILPNFDKRTRQVVYDPAPGGNFAPRLTGLVQFKPTRVSNEPAEGLQAVRLSEETDNAKQIAPDVYQTQQPGWTNAIIRTFPTGWVNQAGGGFPNEYLVGRTPAVGQLNPPPGFSIYAYDPDIYADETREGLEVFDGFIYDQVVKANLPGTYAFTAAVTAANSRSSWLSNARARQVFTPYSVDRNRGRIIASFSIAQVGTVRLPATPEDPNALRANLPLAASGDPYTPYNAPTLTGTWSDPAYNSINARFNKIWNDFPTLRPDNVHRYMDLRVTPQEDGTASPLNPVNGFPRGRVVPGSEVVKGPDQRPGPNMGAIVRYTRTTRIPGPNEYRINYVDQVEPDYTLLDLPPAADLPGFNPNVYDANNFVSAVIQPRFKAGYIQFNSDDKVALPGPSVISVSYRFQFTNGTPNSGTAATATTGRDVFAVDYDTRKLISVLLTIRNYPQSTLPNPQTITLKATATVRNFLR